VGALSPGGVLLGAVPAIATPVAPGAATPLSKPRRPRHKSQLAARRRPSCGARGRARAGEDPTRPDRDVVRQALRGPCSEARLTARHVAGAAGVELKKNRSRRYSVRIAAAGLATSTGARRLGSEQRKVACRPTRPTGAPAWALRWLETGAARGCCNSCMDAEGRGHLRRLLRAAPKAVKAAERHRGTPERGRRAGSRRTGGCVSCRQHVLMVGRTAAAAARPIRGRHVRSDVATDFSMVRAALMREHGGGARVGRPWFGASIPRSVIDRSGARS